MSLIKILKENIDKRKPLICKRIYDCKKNKLKSLEGCPTVVGGSFRCHYNKLKSLVGSPETVGGNFDCSDNKLTSLEGCPKEVRGDFWCINNPKLPKEEILKLKESGIVKGTIFSDYGNF
jgi:hypothetical protein